MIPGTTTRRLSVGEVALEVTEAGAGPAVVLLHGFPETAFSWRFQIPALVEAGYRVIAPDQRGYNRSDKPKDVASYRLEKLAADVCGLLDALEIQRAHVVGHDWGGVVSWAVASLHPSRVNRLVVMNGPHPTHARREIFTNPLQLRRSGYMFLFQIPFVAERLLMRDDFMARAFRGSAVNKAPFDRSALDVYKAAMAQPGAPTATLSWYRAAMRHGLPFLPQVLARTLCIWADRDPALNPRLADTPSRWARDLEVRHVADSGHWVQQERPDLVTPMLLEFLRR